MDFNFEASDNYVDMVNGSATFSTDPTLPPGVNEVDATFSSFDDSPGDFADSSTVSTTYDIGGVAIPATVGNGTTVTTTVQPPPDNAVNVSAVSVTEISAQLNADVSGSGTPPGPLNIDITSGATDITSTLIATPSENAPVYDPETGIDDYFWTIGAGALSAFGATGSATVTVSSPGSTDFDEAENSFTLNWS